MGDEMTDLLKILPVEGKREPAGDEPILYGYIDWNGDNFNIEEDNPESALRHCEERFERQDYNPWYEDSCIIYGLQEQEDGVYLVYCKQERLVKGYGE